MGQTCCYSRKQIDSSSRKNGKNTNTTTNSSEGAAACLAWLLDDLQLTSEICQNYTAHHHHPCCHFNSNFIYSRFSLIEYQSIGRCFTVGQLAEAIQEELDYLFSETLIPDSSSYGVIVLLKTHSDEEILQLGIKKNKIIDGNLRVHSEYVIFDRFPRNSRERSCDFDTGTGLDCKEIRLKSEKHLHSYLNALSVFHRDEELQRLLLLLSEQNDNQKLTSSGLSYPSGSMKIARKASLLSSFLGNSGLTSSIRSKTEQKLQAKVMEFDTQKVQLLTFSVITDKSESQETDSFLSF